MFYGCHLLTSINCSNFNTNDVIDMNGLFGNCSKLHLIKLSDLNTNNNKIYLLNFYNLN